MAIPVEVTIRHGSTDPMDFQLKSDSNPIDLTGAQKVELWLKPSGAGVVKYATTDVPAKLAVTDAANGKVRFSPAAPDLDSAKSPYTGHFWITDAGGNLSSVPDGSEFYILVRPELA